MREPSIHITESNLKKVLNEVLSGKDTDKIVKSILTKSYKYRLNHRQLLVSNQKQAKKANNITAALSEDTSTMNKALLFVRRSFKHRAITSIRAGSADYSKLKSITANAKKFYEEYFESDEKVYDAFVKYVELGIGIMKKFSLATLMARHSDICALYEARIKIAKDPYSELTKRTLSHYNKLTIRQAGTLFVDYLKVPDKYIHFIEVAARCNKLGIKPEVYIDAQFDGLAWANSIPEPHQLTNGRSMEVLQKYLYKNPDKGNIKTQKKTQLVNKLLAIKNRSNGSD